MIKFIYKIKVITFASAVCSVKTKKCAVKTQKIPFA